WSTSKTPSYTKSVSWQHHQQTETFSSLWSEYHDDFRQFLHIYSQDVACYGENLAYFPKGFIENMGTVAKLAMRQPFVLFKGL
ncbi:CatA-like O-acetyltransferase, partial [Escherichia coli]|uniref:CatA-like O-acetyltransferase n=1 Tax=Escherichia coli TaxID=562 RepID=UPI0020227381